MVRRHMLRWSVAVAASLMVAAGSDGSVSELRTSTGTDVEGIFANSDEGEPRRNLWATTAGFDARRLQATDEEASSGIADIAAAALAEARAETAGVAIDNELASLDAAITAATSELGDEATAATAEPGTDVAGEGLATLGAEMAASDKQVAEAEDKAATEVKLEEEKAVVATTAAVKAAAAEQEAAAKQAVTIEQVVAQMREVEAKLEAASEQAATAEQVAAAAAAQKQLQEEIDFEVKKHGAETQAVHPLADAGAVAGTKLTLAPEKRTAAVPKRGAEEDGGLAVGAEAGTAAQMLEQKAKGKAKAAKRVAQMTKAAEEVAAVAGVGGAGEAVEQETDEVVEEEDPILKAKKAAKAKKDAARKAQRDAMREGRKPHNATEYDALVEKQRAEAKAARVRAEAEAKANAALAEAQLRVMATRKQEEKEAKAAAAKKAEEEKEAAAVALREQIAAVAAALEKETASANDVSPGPMDRPTVSVIADGPGVNSAAAAAEQAAAAAAQKQKQLEEEIDYEVEKYEAELAGEAAQQAAQPYKWAAFGALGLNAKGGEASDNDNEEGLEGDQEQAREPQWKAQSEEELEAQRLREINNSVDPSNDWATCGLPEVLAEHIRRGEAGTVEAVDYRANGGLYGFQAQYLGQRPGLLRSVRNGSTDELLRQRGWSRRLMLQEYSSEEIRVISVPFDDKEWLTQAAKKTPQPSPLPTGQPTALPTGQPSPIPTLQPSPVPTPQPNRTLGIEVEDQGRRRLKKKKSGGFASLPLAPGAVGKPLGHEHRPSVVATEHSKTAVAKLSSQGSSGTPLPLPLDFFIMKYLGCERQDDSKWKAIRPYIFTGARTFLKGIHYQAPAVLVDTRPPEPEVAGSAFFKGLASQQDGAYGVDGRMKKSVPPGKVQPEPATKLRSETRGMVGDEHRTPRKDYVHIKYFSLGGHGSGLRFHRHQEAWTEVFAGRKLWLLHEPKCDMDEVLPNVSPRVL